MSEKRVGLNFFFIVFLSLLFFASSISALSFLPPTPETSTEGDSIYVNLSNYATEHYSFVDFESDLIGWWRMDDTEGESVIDLSSYGNNGILLNGASMISGKYGDSGDFDGYDNYISINDSASIDTLAGNDEMTVCVWVKPYSTKNFWAGSGTHPAAGSMGVLGQYWAGGQYNYYKKSWALAEGITAVNGGYAFYVSPDCSSWVDAKSNSALPLNIWSHICGTFDGSTSRLYVNGVQQSDTGSTSGICDTDAPLTIGTYLFSYDTSKDSDLFYNGSVDEVLLFNRALSLNEVKAIYNSSVTRYEHNFTNLAEDNYTFTGSSVNLTGDYESIERTVETGVNNPTSGDAPEISLTSSTYQENNLNITISTSNPSDVCLIDLGAGNNTMSGAGTDFYYDDLTYGEYSAVIYCSNSYGEDTYTNGFEFRRTEFSEDNYYTNSEGLKIYFDFDFNSTSEKGDLVIITDSWGADKDSSWVVDTEAIYVPEGYVVVPMETRGKGLSEGSKDAFGKDCIDVYELVGYLTSDENFSSFIGDVYYLTGASGAGGRAGVCTAKYPDTFAAGYSGVGVLNLTRWWETAGASDVAEIEARVGCDPTECPEAYLARNAAYLGYNTQSPMRVASNTDDPRVSVSCSRDYNTSMVGYGKLINYSEYPTGGHGSYHFDLSLPWFENYNQEVFIPENADMRIGGYLVTKNFSVEFADTDKIGFVDYNLSDRHFEISTMSYEGEANFNIFNLVPNTVYTVRVNGQVYDMVDSGAEGRISLTQNITNQSLILDFNQETDFNITFLAGFVNKVYGYLTGSFVNTIFDEGISAIGLDNSFNGLFTSQVLDAGSEVVWDSIEWESNFIGTIADVKESTVVLYNLNNVSGVIEDGSGNGYDAVNYGASYSSECVVGGCAEFDGVDDYIDAGNEDDFDITDELTIETWVYVDSVDTHNPIVVRALELQGGYYFVYNTQGNLYNRVVNTGSYSDLGYHVNLTDGQWHHIAMSFNSSRQILFVDGEVVNSRIPAISSIGTNERPLYIGKSTSGYWGGGAFDGKIDEVVIYNKSLSPEEVQADYQKGYMNFSVQVRSCDDSQCAGEEWTLVEFNGEDLWIADNRYVQYKADFETDDLDYAPVLFNVTLVNSEPNRTSVNLQFDAETYEAFVQYCEDNNLVVVKELEKMIEEKLNL